MTNLYQWLSSATSRDVVPHLVCDVQQLVDDGRAEWMPDRVVHLGDGMQKRKRVRVKR